MNDQFFRGSYIEPYWTRDYKSTSGLFWDGVPYWSVSMVHGTADGIE